MRKSINNKTNIIIADKTQKIKVLFSKSPNEFAV